MPEDISRYYTDLLDDDLVTDWHWFPTIFDQYIPVLGTQQPFRYMCHNGEINLRGNISRMREGIDAK
jgi:glutamate synthase (ferredoxin)